MEKLANVFGVMALSVGGVFLFVIAATCLGALSGWIVGLVFSDVILGILSRIGIKNVTMWQFGAFMGFVGGFLKTKVTVTRTVIPPPS